MSFVKGGTSSTDATPFTFSPTYSDTVLTRPAQFVYPTPAPDIVFTSFAAVTLSFAYFAAFRPDFGTFRSSSINSLLITAFASTLSEIGESCSYIDGPPSVTSGLVSTFFLPSGKVIDEHEFFFPFGVSDTSFRGRNTVVVSEGVSCDFFTISTSASLFETVVPPGVSAKSTSGTFRGTSGAFSPIPAPRKFVYLATATTNSRGSFAV